MGRPSARPLTVQAYRPEYSLNKLRAGGRFVFRGRVLAAIREWVTSVLASNNRRPVFQLGALVRMPEGGTGTVVEVIDRPEPFPVIRYLARDLHDICGPFDEEVLTEPRNPAKHAKERSTQIARAAGTERLKMSDRTDQMQIHVLKRV